MGWVSGVGGFCGWCGECGWEGGMRWWGGGLGGLGLVLAFSNSCFLILVARVLILVMARYELFCICGCGKLIS